MTTVRNARDPRGRWSETEFNLAVYLRRSCSLGEDAIADALAVSGLGIRLGSDVRRKLQAAGMWKPLEAVK